MISSLTEATLLTAAGLMVAGPYGWFPCVTVLIIGPIVAGFGASRRRR